MEYGLQASSFAFAAIGFLHHAVAGANRVSEEDERNAERLTEGK